MDWDVWFCPKRSCTAQIWLLQRCRDQHGVWRIVPRMNAQAWTIAATLPACPQCGATLITPIDLVIGRAGEDGANRGHTWAMPP